MKRMLLLGCLHLGSKAHRKDLTKQYMDKVVKEDMDILLLGDLFECATPSKQEQMYEQTSTTDEQLDEAVELFRPVKSRIKGCVTSNHSERAYKAAGVNLDRRLIRELGLPESLYKGFHGVIKYRGKTIVFSHGNGSGCNTWGDAEKLVRMYPAVDVIALSHRHSLDAGWRGRFEVNASGQRIKKDILMVRTGSLLDYPRYAQKELYFPQKLGFTVLNFNDDGSVTPDISGV